MKTISWKASLIVLFGLACFAIGQQATSEIRPDAKGECPSGYRPVYVSESGILRNVCVRVSTTVTADTQQSNKDTVSGGLLIDTPLSPIAFRMQSESKEILTISREGKLTVAEGLTMDEAAKEFIIVLEKQFGRQLVDLQTPCSLKKNKE